MSIIRLLNIKKKIKPETFYEQLAKDGLLVDYLNKFLSDKLNSDEEFKREIFETLLLHSKEPVVEVEKYYMEKLIASLSYFLEYTSQWREQNQ
ncbi:MAG TPA: hypothetical protein PLU67_05670 [Candidatus Kapabacteria bacterium]|nr:hypothetical protein [Candidatus Kapabacteria bacterium]HOM04968.1 hypothetical protein [Candidatus Kapabacteria bacterium]HPU22551.1 hypothetical protein [Candidatus Kapabacteria bacterium]